MACCKHSATILSTGLHVPVAVLLSDYSTVTAAGAFARIVTAELGVATLILSALCRYRNGENVLKLFSLRISPVILVLSHEIHRVRKNGTTLFLWSPYVLGQTVIFSCCDLFFFFFFFYFLA